MINRRTLLKGALATSAAALGGVLGAFTYPYSRPFSAIRDAAGAKIGDTLHLNARHNPKPTVPHTTHNYGNGNVWYSLTLEQSEYLALSKQFVLLGCGG